MLTEPIPFYTATNVPLWADNGRWTCRYFNSLEEAKLYAQFHGGEIAETTKKTIWRVSVLEQEYFVQTDE